MIKKVLSGYGLFVLLLIYVALAAGISLTLCRINAEADKALADIEARSSALSFEAVSKKSAELYTAADGARILVFTDKEARENFLNTLDSFLKKYNAKVISPMTKTNNTYRSRISFRFTPKTPQELAVLLEYLENSSSPVFIVDDTAFINDRDGSYVNITTEMIQPFSGEK